MNSHCSGLISIVLDLQAQLLPTLTSTLPEKLQKTTDMYIQTSVNSAQSQCGKTAKMILFMGMKYGMSHERPLNGLSCSVKRMSSHRHLIFYLKDDEHIDSCQDQSSDKHLCFHGYIERLVSHGQRDHLTV